jgi:hypothetical protein
LVCNGDVVLNVNCLIKYDDMACPFWLCVWLTLMKWHSIFIYFLIECDDMTCHFDWLFDWVCWHDMFNMLVNVFVLIVDGLN